VLHIARTRAAAAARGPGRADWGREATALVALKESRRQVAEVAAEGDKPNLVSRTYAASAGGNADRLVVDAGGGCMINVLVAELKCW